MVIPISDGMPRLNFNPMPPIHIASPGFDDNPENVLLFLEALNTRAVKRSVRTRVRALYTSLAPTPTGDRAVDRRMNSIYQLVQTGDSSAQISGLRTFLDSQYLRESPPDAKNQLEYP